MTIKLTIDFGTTNSVIARWDGDSETAALLTLPGLSTTDDPAAPVPPLVPSLVYLQDGTTGRAVVGQAVREADLDCRPDNRLFRSFKRGIMAVPSPEPRLVDGQPWADRDVGRLFLRRLLDALPYDPAELDQLVLTAPVASFSNYLGWLSEMVDIVPPERVRVVDESTAAALGYAITEPGALVLVCDFGGGTLDLSLVQLPESRSRAGGLLGRLRGGSAHQHAACVIAKGGRLLGGSDVDQWLLADVLARTGLTVTALGHDYPALLTACEHAKIALTVDEATTLTFTTAGRDHEVRLTRAELEALLDSRGFFVGLRQTIDRMMHVARRQGIFREDIHHVLMVGGISLMPSVQRVLGHAFTPEAIRVNKPFTAVVEGALQVAAGQGLEDYLAHSYGLRHLDPVTGQPAYDEIIPAGSAYPLSKPVEVTLGAAHEGQRAVELVVGEIDTDAVAMVEVLYEEGQTVFVAKGAHGGQQVIPLNEPGAAAHPCQLSPPGKPGPDRLRAAFTIDESRRLRVTVTDLQTKKMLLHDVILATLGEGAPATTGASIMPQVEAGPDISLEDFMARFREQLWREFASSLLTDRANGAVSASPPAEALTGLEPRLSTGISRGQQRLSLRRLGTLLNTLPPEAIALEAAAAMLRSNEFFVRYNAGKTLARRGDRDARRILQDALTDAPPPSRASAARHLYGFSWYAAEPLLRQALADPDQRVREAAIYALCDMRDLNAYRLAAETLQDETDEVRLAAAWALNNRQDPAAVPVLAAALLADDPDVRIQALESLGATAVPEALPIVRRSIESDLDPGVKYAAVLSLIELAGEDCLAEVADRVRTAAGATRAAILRGLFQATNYLHIDVAGSAAVETLVDALTAALGDANPAARLAAVWPLAWINHPRAPDLLADTFRREPDGEARLEMLRIITALMSPAGATILADALASPDADLRDLAVSLSAQLAPHAAF